MKAPLRTETFKPAKILKAFFLFGITRLWLQSTRCSSPPLEFLRSIDELTIEWNSISAIYGSCDAEDDYELYMKARILTSNEFVDGEAESRIGIADCVDFKGKQQWILTSCDTNIKKFFIKSSPTAFASNDFTMGRCHLQLATRRMELVHICAWKCIRVIAETYWED